MGLDHGNACANAAQSTLEEFALQLLSFFSALRLLGLPDDASETGPPRYRNQDDVDLPRTPRGAFFYPQGPLPTQGVLWCGTAEPHRLPCGVLTFSVPRSPRWTTSAPLPASPKTPISPSFRV